MRARPPHRARRRFGQHFLHETAIIDRIIVAVAPAAGGAVVEIGPGLGALTGPLLESAGELDVIEIDRDLAARLREVFPDEAALRIHNVDALKFDFKSLAERRGPLRVVGNLPYNISTPLLFRFIDQGPSIADMHLMLQKEVVDRIDAGPGSRDYGRLSVMVQFRCRVEALFTVGPGAFSPPPKVSSAVVRLSLRDIPPAEVADPAALSRIVSLAFGQRRKTLRNSLKACLPQARISAAGIDPGARAETLSLAQFAALANALADADSQGTTDV
jgi:16S rRNA (adenine1518-N6/adenine1519-N6)-dimethyltransferase